MQTVAALIEQLRKAGIEVPAYPLLDGPFDRPEAIHPTDGALIEARVGDFEARVVQWRQQVLVLHAQHF